MPTPPRKRRFLEPSIRLWGLLTGAGAVLAATTLMGCLGRYSWFLDLFSHFRAQYALGLGILSALLLAGRRWRAASACALFAAINVGFIIPLYLGGKQIEPVSGRPLRAMLLNVNTSQGDPERVRQLVADVDPDLLVLEEISLRWTQELAPLTNAYPHAIVQAREDNFGIGLYSKHPLEEGEIAYIGDSEVPSILATVGVGEQTLRVIATHPVPPAGAEYSRWRNNQLAEIPRYVDAAIPLILLGDLNVTPWNRYFRQLRRDSGLLDSAQGRGVQTTWPSFSPLLRIPLDHVLHSPQVVITRRTIGPHVVSDHYPVIVEFVILPEN